jgi:hypothetical protein
MSECRLLGQRRGTQRYLVTQRNDEDALTLPIIQLGNQDGRYGYRRITALLRNADWCIGRGRCSGSGVARGSRRCFVNPMFGCALFLLVFYEEPGGFDYRLLGNA